VPSVILCMPVVLPDEKELVALVEQHGSLVAVANVLGLPDDNGLHRLIRRYEAQGIPLRARVNAARAKSGVGKPSTTHRQWPEDVDLAQTIRDAPSVIEAARSLGVPEGSLRSRCQSRGIDITALRMKDRTTVDGNTAILEASELKDATELVESRGFSLEEWEIVTAVCNEWGFNQVSGKPFTQLKLTLKKRVDLEWVFPAFDVVVKPRPKRVLPKTASEVWVLVGDHQAPLHSERAHKAFVRFCERVRPAKGVHIGDLIDLGNISRFGDSGDDRFNRPVQDCINTGYKILKEIVTASPETEWSFMLGNHDERIRTELLRRCERIYGIRPADIPGVEQVDALSLRRLLRLDELGIECIDEAAGYKHNRIRIGNDFEVRHGMFTGQNPAKKTMDSLQASVAVGHTHSKSTVFKSLFDRDGVSQVLQAAEIGVMSENNLGYNHGRSDWHPGWATVTLFPNGLTHIDHAVFHEKEGVAIWQSQQF